MSKKKGYEEPLQISEGDVVRFRFPYSSNDSDKKIRVSEVRERYGTTAPLIIGKEVLTGEREMIDQSYAIEIVSRCPAFPRRQPRNVFRGARYNVHFEGADLVSGDIEMLAIWALGRLPFQLLRPIDPDLVKELFLKTKPGCVEGSYGYYTVRKKHFVPWVRQNAYRMLCTTEKANAAALLEEEKDDLLWQDFLD